MTAQLTPRAQAVIADSDEYTAPIFRERPGGRAGARFPSTSCSSCGKGFGPDNEGFSHCADHAAIAATAATGEAS